MIIYSNFIIDRIRGILILLTLLIIRISLIIFELNYLINKFYLFILILLNLILILSFRSINIFKFYFYFEFRLIPIFLLVIGWGYQVERVKAALYILIYTIFFSLPLLLFLFLFIEYSSVIIFIINKEMGNLGDFWSIIFRFIIFIAFLVKLPIFIFHNWLPKAHVEAPVVGRVILASLILKLGGYGIYRILRLIGNKFIQIRILIIAIRLVGIILLRFVCLRVYDIKVIVAYSSVVHIGIILLGLFRIKIWGFVGGLIIILGHGFTSSGLFIIVNIFYNRSIRRNLLINKGKIYFFPSLILFWFFMCINNISSPISLNLLREIIIISVLLNWRIKIICFLILRIFFRACYNLYLFSYSFHGIYFLGLFKFSRIKIIEYLILLIHLIPLNLMVLKFSYLI